MSFTGAWHATPGLPCQQALASVVPSFFSPCLFKFPGNRRLLDDLTNPKTTPPSFSALDIRFLVVLLPKSTSSGFSQYDSGSHLLMVVCNPCMSSYGFANGNLTLCLPSFALRSTRFPRMVELTDKGICRLPRQYPHRRAMNKHTIPYAFRDFQPTSGWSRVLRGPPWLAY